MPEYEHILKVVIIGDSGVGKSCILLRYVDELFTESFIVTIGVDFKFKTIDIDDKKVKIQIWDTAGQERFRSITTAYYRGADCLIIVYDITNRETFNNVEKWIKDARNYIKHDIPIVIVGNKSDRDDRIVSFEELKNFSKEHNTLYIECSAKTGNHIEILFNDIAKELILKRKEKQDKQDKIDQVKINNNKISDINIKPSCC